MDDTRGRSWRGRRPVWIVSMGLLAGAAPAMPPSEMPVSPPALALTDVTVIDVSTGQRHAAQTVVIVGNRIQAVDASKKVKVPVGARVIDAQGKYLIPGFWDMHAHVDRRAERMYKSYIAYGVTGLREMAQRFPSGTDSFRVWQRAIAAGTRIGPRVVGPSFDESYDEQTDRQDGNPMPTPEAIHRVVDSLKRAGFAFVKLHNTGMTREHFWALARETRQAGLPLVGHVPADVSEIEAIDSGQHGIEHVHENHTCWPDFPAPMDSLAERRCAPVAAAYVRHGAWLVPTLYFFYHYFGSLRNAQQYVQLLHRAGVPLLAGTDYMREVFVHVEYPGVAALEEISFMAGAGLTPLEALQTATLNPAIFFNATDSLGTVAPGKLADLVVLDADPLVDIANVTRTWAVVANGRYFDRAALDELRAAAQPTTRETPDAYVAATVHGTRAAGLDFGYQEAARFVSPEPLRQDLATSYTAPSSSAPKTWGLVGKWIVGRDRVTLPAGPGRIVLRFDARYLNLFYVAGPSGTPLRFQVWLDGRAPGDDRGQDISPEGDQSIYGSIRQLVHQRGTPRERTLEIEFQDPVTVYGVSFDPVYADVSGADPDPP